MSAADLHNFTFTHRLEQNDSSGTAFRTRWTLSSNDRSLFRSAMLVQKLYLRGYEYTGQPLAEQQDHLSFQENADGIVTRLTRWANLTPGTEYESWYYIYDDQKGALQQPFYVDRVKTQGTAPPPGPDPPPTPTPDPTPIEVNLGVAFGISDTAFSSFVGTNRIFKIPIKRSVSGSGTTIEADTATVVVEIRDSTGLSLALREFPDQIFDPASIMQTTYELPYPEYNPGDAISLWAFAYSEKGYTSPVITRTLTGGPGWPSPNPDPTPSGASWKTFALIGVIGALGYLGIRRMK